MTFKFTEQDHARLATLFDGRCEAGPHTLPGRPYDGYKPTVREAPNGDTKVCAVCQGRLSRHCKGCDGTGRVPNVDDGRAAKRWLHVAPKYNPPQWAADYYDRAFAEACRVATALNVPAAYRPHEAYGALRVLEYPSAGHYYGRDPYTCDHCEHQWHALQNGGELVCPALAPGAGTVEHKDPDLFTIVLWRSTMGDLERLGPGTRAGGDRAGELGATAKGLHIGEIGELVGLGPATPHRVPARPYVQKSIIYFAIPDWAAQLTYYDDQRFNPGKNGLTVGEWLADAMKRRRYEAQT